MIYIIGDSFSFGWNFFKDKNPSWDKITYGTILGEKFDEEVTNLSIPASSNWRITRLLLSLDLKSEDKVVVGWTNPDRIELGILPNSKSMLDDFIEVENLKNHKKLGDLKIETLIDGIEKNKDLLIRRIFPSQYHSPKTIRNHKFRSFVSDFYTYYGGLEWFEEMFLMNFCSALYKLRQSGCKFLMFNTYNVPYSLKKNSLLEIPEYVFGPYCNMTDEIRVPANKRYKNIETNYVDYWSEEEHQKVADILFRSFST